MTRYHSTDCRSRAKLTADIHLKRRRYIDAELWTNEKDWRLNPGDGGDPAIVSERALEREFAIAQHAQDAFRTSSRRAIPASGVPEASPQHDRTFERIWHRLKYFPVLFISAPHVGEEGHGAFPGIPTPLLYATSVLDRHLKIDEFPSLRVPEVVAVMNPPRYDERFRSDLAHTLRRYRPRVIGISNVSEGHYYALRIAKEVKTALPDAIVVLGGAHEDGTNPEVYRRAAEFLDSNDSCLAQAGRRPHLNMHGLRRDHVATMESLQTLATPEERETIDFVASGDGPYLFMELMRLFADHERGSKQELKRAILANAARFAELEGSGHLFFWMPETNTIEHVQLSGRPLDRDRLPFMDLGRLTHENRFPIFRGKKTGQVMACGGCKYACSYCHESEEYRLYEVPKLQKRKPENVAKELDLLSEQDYQAVFFDDSTFTQNPSFVGRLVELIRVRAHEQWHTPLEWGCQTTINDVSRDLLARMAAAGCTYIYFGLESASPSRAAVHKVVGLRTAVANRDWGHRFKRVATWCQEYGIRVGTSLQFGLNESPAERRATIDLLAELRRQGCLAPGCVALNVNSPYPGTLQWVELLVRGTGPMPDYRQSLVRHPMFETAHQFSSLGIAIANDIVTEAIAKLGDAIVGADQRAV